MRALVVYESMFGNTEAVARAIAEGIESSMHADVVEVGAAPSTVPADATLLVGGGHRPLAEHLATHLRRRLPAYEVVTDLEAIPLELRGLHPRNPVNLARGGGVQVELPPRVRGTSPLFWDWEGPGLNPHTQALVDALVDTVGSWAG